eukprot:7096060-Pyramimonas_sp.AAC.1
MQYVDWETPLAGPADAPAAAVHFTAARHLRFSMYLERCAGELFEEVCVGHDGANLADWLGMPIAGQQPAHIEFVEGFHVPAEIEHDMAGAPANSEAIIPAAEEEMPLMLHLQVIGNPIDRELCDDDPPRGNPRNAGDVSERIQCELEHNEGHHF